MNFKILVIFLVLLIIYIFIFIKKDNLYHNDPIYDYASIRDKIKTGDIMLFSLQAHDTLVSQIKYYCRTQLLGSEFGHVGIILRNRHKIYLIECTTHTHSGYLQAHHLNNHQKGGVRIIDLDVLLKEYQKNNKAIFAIKFISKEIPNKVFFKALESYRPVTFPDITAVTMLGILDIGISHNLSNAIAHKTDPKKKTCGEFVHEILYRCRVLKYYPSKLFWPHLYVDNAFQELEIVKYSKPYKFKL